MSNTLRRLLVLATLVVLALPIVLKTASADDTTRRRAVAPTPAPTARSFAPNQVEAYLSDDGIAYIRPGLKVKVNSITVTSDKKFIVDANLTDNFDQPLDRAGKLTPGAISVSFLMAGYDGATRHYTSFATRSQTSPATSPNPGVTAVQAGTDSGGTFTDLETGHFKYTFKTTLPTYYDVSKTCTLGLYATRNLADQIGKTYYANVEQDFRPDGAKVTETWDKISQAACNNCHNPLSAHGGSRQDVKLCVICHQEQTTDPDTGNTVDMKVMAHKIHMGEHLPSVAAGKPYQIIGNANSMHDFSDVALPMDIRNCVRCHEGTVAANKPSQASAWMTNPSRSACGSCHDDINWVTGANHPAGAQKDDSACANCHVADSGKEFDASVKGAHVIPQQSKQLLGLKASIVSASNFAPGQKPTVVFRVTNNDGTAVDATKLATFGPKLGGNSASYSKYFSESGVGKTGFDATTGNTTYAFTNAIPADATGTWTVSADFRRNVTLKRADGKADIALQESTLNPIKYVAVTGTLTPRRSSVALANCNNCHETLRLHGEQRQNTEECVICHNPTEGDQARRPASAGATESVSFQRLIHRIHSGEELTQDFTIYGFGGTPNNFNEVRFPGDRTDCVKCHVNVAAYSLPLQSGIGSVTTARDYFSPQGPGTAACLGCHDNQDAAAHAYLNTTTFGGTKPTEACATCHGTGKDWDVAKVHAH
jgi:OmcA/MtrC family decaheme c-type cytochrome